MQYLDITKALETTPKPQPIDPELYQNKIFYVQYNIELDFLWVTIKRNVPGNFLVGEL
jgi:hypothetical protein